MSNGLSDNFGPLTRLLPTTSVDHRTNPGNPSPSLRRITGPHRYYETVRPCAPHRYPTPRRFRCLGHSRRPASPPPGRHRWGDRFPRFVPVPDPNSRHLCAGHHLASQQAPARLVPGQQRDPGFDDTSTLSTFQQWFTLVRLLGPHLTPSRAPFPRRSPPRLLTAAARGGLRPPLQGDPGGPTSISITSTTPHPRSRTSTSQPPSAFVAHRRRHRARSAAPCRAELIGRLACESLGRPGHR